MAVELTFEMRPDFRMVARAFDEMALQFADMKEPLLWSAEIASQDAERRFAEEGPGWADWALGHQVPQGHGTIGDLSGDMRAHAGSNAGYEVGADTVAYHFEGEKESAFQFGNTRQPARPFIGLSQEGEDLVELAFAIWMEQIIGEVAGGAGEAGGFHVSRTVSKTGRVSFRDARGRFTSRPPGF